MTADRLARPGPRRTLGRTRPPGDHGAHRSTYLDYAASTHPGEPLAPPNVVTTLADMYGFDPLAGGLAVADPANGRSPGVLGTQAQLWTEFVPTPDRVRS